MDCRAINGYCLQKFQCLFENNPDGVCELDMQGRFVEVNHAYEQITGRSRNELLGMNFVEVMFQEDVVSAIQRFESGIRGEHLNDAPARIKHKNGKCVLVQYTRVPIIVNNEVTGLYAIAKDITEQRKMEDLLKQSQNMLAHSQRIAHVGSWEFDPVNKRSFWSEELFNIYGIENTGYIYLSDVVEYVHPEDRESLVKSVKALSEGQPYDIEFRIIRADGEVRVLHSKREMNVTNGEIRLIGTVQDITDQKYTQELLLRSEKLSVVGQLAAGVAHEIRNPLTALKGFVQLMYPKSKGTNKRYFNVMQIELNRIQQILDELLLLAKPQAVKYTVEDIGLLLHEVVSLMDAQAIMHHVNIETDIEKNLPHVICAPNQLKQVFINVMKNAIEAMAVGGTVSIEAKRCGGSVAITFVDEGEGIAADKLPRLGEPFFTTKDKGTGLGLLVCHKIISGHNGTIDISSKVGVGTKISISLPIET